MIFDHLSNRRVRAVGEQLFAQFGVGLAVWHVQFAKEWIVRDNEGVSPVDLIFNRPFIAVIKFILRNKPVCLSSWPDRPSGWNDSVKRRMSALDQVVFTWESRIWSKGRSYHTLWTTLSYETPEGPNTHSGLISSLCVFAKINALVYRNALS